jgi:NADH oxidase (H2O2-forming)
MAAAERGAEVTILEGGGALPSPKSSWPSLIAEGERQPTTADQRALTSAGIKVEFNQDVTTIGQDLAIDPTRVGPPFESVVLATGSTGLQERIVGSRKKGVHLLDSRAAFSELAGGLSRYGKAVIYGGGPAAVEVGERLRSRGVSASLLSPGGVLPFLNPGPRRLVLEGLSSWGISFSDGKPDKVVGVDRVEAVISSGEVMPCDAFIVVPRRVPAVPRVPAELGRSGGVVVDGMMHSSAKDIYAAGDCAEVRLGGVTLGVMFESSARLMGSVAGANAAGARVKANVTGSFFKELVGVGVAASGLGLAEASGLALDVSETSRSWRGELACSIVSEKASGTVLGVQLAGKGVERFAETIPLVVSSRMTLEQVAFQETGVSSDISPISETAREGLRERRPRS